MFALILTVISHYSFIKTALFLITPGKYGFLPKAVPLMELFASSDGCLVNILLLLSFFPPSASLSFLSLTGHRNATRRSIYSKREEGRGFVWCRGNSFKKIQASYLITSQTHRNTTAFSHTVSHISSNSPTH